MDARGGASPPHHPTSPMCGSRPTLRRRKEKKEEQWARHQSSSFPLLRRHLQTSPVRPCPEQLSMQDYRGERKKRNPLHDAVGSHAFLYRVEGKSGLIITPPPFYFHPTGDRRTRPLLFHHGGKTGRYLGGGRNYTVDAQSVASHGRGE